MKQDYKAWQGFKPRGPKHKLVWCALNGNAKLRKE